MRDIVHTARVGTTREKVERNMNEAIELRVQGLYGNNLPIPESNSFAGYVAVH